jgi:hypothetical protein
VEHAFLSFQISLFGHHFAGVVIERKTVTLAGGKSAVVIPWRLYTIIIVIIIAIGAAIVHRRMRATAKHT